MVEESPRQALERLAMERGDDLSALSRLIGRNPAYVQQFIRRGTPRRLAEDDRRVLAEYFGVDESVLGRPAGKGRSPADFGGDLMAVARYAVGASAGHGALATDEAELSRIAFPARWLRDMASGDPAHLSIIHVDGDSMDPTLSNGDEILVDRADAGDRLRDGIYVLRQDDALIVKRIAINPARPRGDRRFTIKSDNPGYPDWPDCELGDVEVIGRVVWTGRRVV